MYNTLSLGKEIHNMKRKTVDVIATKMIEVYEKDHTKLKAQAVKRGMSLRSYMHYLADKEG